MVQTKPWERYAQPTSGMPAGTIQLAPPAPDYAYKEPLAQAHINEAQATAERNRIGNRVNAATADADIRKARAQAAAEEVAARNAQQKFALDNQAEMRKEYNNLPDVKNYMAALPVYASALQSKPTPSGDLDLIYAFAKIMDPNSVVREGEQASVGQSAPWISQQIANAQKQLGAGGSFTDEYRQELRNELRTRMAQLDKQFIAQRVRYKQQALQNGFDPKQVVGEHPGVRFQSIEANAFGQDVPHLDFNGNPISGVAGGPDDRAPASPPTPSGVASGATKDVYSPEASALIDQGVRSHWSDQKIANAIKPYGFGWSPETSAQVQAARRYFADHPNYPGSFGHAVRQEGTTLLNRAAASGPAAAFEGALNGATGGFLDEGIGVANSVLSGEPLDKAIAEADFAKNMMSRAHPRLYGAGNLLGNAGTYALGGIGAAKLGAQALGKFAPVAGDLAFGAINGAGEDNNNRLGGAALGGLTSVAGGMFGRGVLAPGLSAVARTRPALSVANGVRRFRGIPEITLPDPLSPGQRMVANAANKAGVENITPQLNEAARLNVPMTLADTDPQLRELAGAAVRRSPTAAKTAEDALLPRQRGQIERFTQSVNSNLGPTANIPQLSADLTQQAQTAAAPLYEQAYAAPGASSVDISDLINRPLSMRPGLSRAFNIAKEEGRDPTSLGFDLTEQGDVTLNRVPSFQTLDYVKRGLDDALEPHRSDLTGKLQLNEATRAINATKNDLLGRIDAVNPAYKQARAAYAGPVQARDALAAGRDAYGLTPNDLTFKLSNMPPHLIDQMRLGYRDALMNQANRVRYNSNPFDATLGNPLAEQRLRIMHPDNPGVSDLLRQRDLEGKMARTTNDILGNSKTAQRGIADEQFAGNDWPTQAVDVGINLATGQVPTGVLLKAGTSRAVKDAFKMGVGKRAAQRAEEIAPILVNPNPTVNISDLTDMLKKDQIYRDYVQQQIAGKRRGSGIFGASLGTTGSQYLLSR